LVVGVAVARALTSRGLDKHQLKWPNDLFWNDRKLGGILIEATGEVTGPSVIVIGIGINIDMPDTVADKIDQDWVDLTTAVGRKVSRNAIAAAVIKEVFNGLAQFEEQGFDGFYREWQSLDLLKGRPVQLLIGDDVMIGYAEGVDKQGALLVRCENGAIKRCFSGEVSVRYSV
jgi:BirA family biotin operon repressor/biotin-[acetyl-CoA-carboxylase] ligase